MLYIYLKYILAHKFDKKMTLKEIKNRLHQMTKVVDIDNCKVVFVLCQTVDTSILSASATLPGCICFNVGWAIRLLLYNDELTLKTFKATAYHEFAHKKQYFSLLKHRIPFSVKTYRFVSWCNETYADFYAMKQFDNKSEFFNTLNYKMKLKNLNELTKNHVTHPSWLKRLQYVSNYDFNENLIRKIAADTNFTDEHTIQTILKFFSI